MDYLEYNLKMLISHYQGRKDWLLQDLMNLNEIDIGLFGYDQKMLYQDMVDKRKREIKLAEATIDALVELNSRRDC